MRIISYNVNGIRAAIKKGLIDWLKTNPADIICLQETKATKDDVDLKQFEDLGFHHHWYSAQKKGYSGVAVFSKIKPDNVVIGNGHKETQRATKGTRTPLAKLRPDQHATPVSGSGAKRLAVGSH